MASPALPPTLPTDDLPAHIERILDAARLAPSHDNLQPWRFAVRGETVSFYADADRDRGPDDGGVSARVAVGASLECALLRAGRMGAKVRFESPAPGALVTVTITDPKRFVEPDKALLRRATNRRLYDGRPLDDDTFTWLSEAIPPMDSATVHWFGRERVRVLAPILGEGEELYYGTPQARAAAIRALRFDARDREEVTHGLSIGSLELSTADRMAFEALRQTPQERLLSMAVCAKLGARARRLAESASGICIIAAKRSDPAADVAVGRCMQRAWLSLTRRGLVAQPMNAIVILESMLHRGIEGTDGDRITAVAQSLRAAFPNLGEARIGVVMRFGWAAAPTSHVRRLALSESLAAIKS